MKLKRMSRDECQADDRKTGQGRGTISKREDRLVKC